MAVNATEWRAKTTSGWSGFGLCHPKGDLHQNRVGRLSHVGAASIGTIESCMQGNSLALLIPT